MVCVEDKAFQLAQFYTIKTKQKQTKIYNKQKITIMKNSIKTIAAIIVVIVSMNSSFGKTKKMTVNQFQLKYNQVDSSLIGTWEKNKTANSKTTDTYCQFNQNGTYITFEKEKENYTITGKGKWIIENEKITIVAGNEVSSKTAFISSDNYLQFGNNVTYTKPSALYVTK